MHPDDRFRPPGHRRQLHDRDRRRVRGQDGVAADDHLVERAKDRGFHLLVLGHRLDHQLTVLERVEVGGVVQASRGLGTGGRVELLPPHSLCQRGVNAVATGLRGGLVALDDHDVETPPGAHFGDPRAHEPATDNTNPFDFHGHTVDDCSDNARPVVRGYGARP